MKLFKKRREKVVENIEVYSKRPWLRLIIVIVLILIGISSITYGLVSCLNRNTGWQEIELSKECYMIAPEISLSYNLGASGVSATVEYKKISALYSEIAYKAYSLFNVYEECENTANLLTLSHKLNREVSVDPLLYDALKLMEDKGGRHLYFAPLYAQNEQVCISDDDYTASLSDPSKNEDVAKYYAEVLGYVQSPRHIKLELKGNNKVKLIVSDEYMSFAKKNKIDVFLDFYWLRNAFIVDTIADKLIAEGYRLGNVSSRNGFVRNLDDSGTNYSTNLFSLVDKKIYTSAAVSSQGASAFVYFRSFPVVSYFEYDNNLYYVYDNGDIVSQYVSLSDGNVISSVSSLLSASKKLSCAEIALETYPYYTSELFSEDSADALKDLGVSVVWTDGKMIGYNDDAYKPYSPYSDDSITFNIEKIK